MVAYKIIGRREDLSAPSLDFAKQNRYGGIELPKYFSEFEGMGTVDFFKIAIRDYRRVGALNPTSSVAARKIAGQIGPEHRFVIEYGAGDGAVTREILKRLPVAGRLVAVEINEKFVSRLRRIKDDRLTIVQGDVRHFSTSIAKSGLQNVDVIISGIPFSCIDLNTKKEIIENTYRALSDSGIFIAYQNSLHILPLLRTFFKGNVWWYFEPRNFLPYFVIISEKNSAIASPGLSGK